MNIEKRVSQLENGNDEYSLLKSKFFFNVPIVVDDNGNVLNPVHEEDKEEFSRFLAMAEQRGML